jgi:hypothetical protein
MELAAFDINSIPSEWDSFQFEKSALVEACLSLQQNLSSRAQYSMPGKPFRIGGA